MQVRPDQINVNDKLVVMTKAIVNVVAVEPHPDGTQIGARRVVVEFVAPFANYDTMDVPATAAVERMHGAPAVATDTEANGHGTYL